MAYIYSHDNFTVKEIVKTFPDISYGTIYGYIYNAKIIGLIACIDKGKYKVNKDKIPKNDF